MENSTGNSDQSIKITSKTKSVFAWTVVAGGTFAPQGALLVAAKTIHNGDLLKFCSFQSQNKSPVPCESSAEIQR